MGKNGKKHILESGYDPYSVGEKFLDALKALKEDKK